MMPTSIRPEYYQVKFKFFRGENLPIMDKNLFTGAGSIDAFVEATYSGKTLKT